MEMQINCMQTFKWAQRICHLHIDKHIRKYKSCLVDFFGVAGDLLRATTRAETKKSRYFLRMFYTHLRLLCSSMLGKKCLQIEVRIYLFQLNLCSAFFRSFSHLVHSEKTFNLGDAINVHVCCPSALLSGKCLFSVRLCYFL